MKRLSLFLVLALALSAMLIACAKNEGTAEDQGCTDQKVDWSKISNNKSNPTLLELTSMVSFSEGTFQTFISTDCNFLDEKQKEKRGAATIKDCWNSGTSEGDSSKNSKISPAGNSVVALYLAKDSSGADQLFVTTKIQMDKNSGNVLPSVPGTSDAQAYQYTEWHALAISDNYDDQCNVVLRLNADSDSKDIYEQKITDNAKYVAIAYNANDMSDSTGDPKQTLNDNTNGSLVLRFNAKTNVMSLDSVLLNAGGISGVTAKTVIKAGLPTKTLTPGNKMAIAD